MKQEREVYDFATETNFKLTVIRWFDNSAVELNSTHFNVHFLKNITRWDEQAGKRLELQCPALMHEYNRHMREVNLFDMLSAHYRNDHKSSMWYKQILL